MSHWVFVAAAYAVAGIGTLGLLAASFADMRRAEAVAEAPRNEA